MVICFGEILLRLSPPGAYRFPQADSFDAVYGGAEANVAVALAGFGDPSAVVTRLPDNDIGRSAAQSHLRFGVDVSRVSWGGSRIGIYFLEKGASLRPSKVLYDRRGSAMAEASPADFDWERILGGSGSSPSPADAFFFTGITPALSPALPGILGDALALCRARKIPVFCDVNYRSALWTPEQAAPVMRSLARGIDTLTVNEEHAALLFGVSPLSGADGPQRQPDDERIAQIAASLVREYGVRRVALTFRLSESSEINTVSGALWEDGRLYRSRAYRVPIVDRIGGGDAFSAGLIHGTLAGWDPARTVEFAAAANALKHSVHGDALIAREEEVARLAQSDGTVRMIR